MCSVGPRWQFTVRLTQKRHEALEEHLQRLRAEHAGPGHICRSHALTDVIEHGLEAAEREEFEEFNAQLPKELR